LKSFIEKQDDFWIKVQIPYKPNAVISYRIASFDIAIAILEETKSKILIKFLSKKIICFVPFCGCIFNFTINSPFSNAKIGYNFHREKKLKNTPIRTQKFLT
jgi:hypothetical protein